MKISRNCYCCSKHIIVWTAVKEIQAESYRRC